MTAAEKAEKSLCWPVGQPVANTPRPGCAECAALRRLAVVVLPDNAAANSMQRLPVISQGLGTGAIYFEMKFVLLVGSTWDGWEGGGEITGWQG